jgi:hypothetical protein
MSDDPNPDLEIEDEPTPDPAPIGGIGTGINPAPPPGSNEPLDFSSEATYSQFVASLPEEIREKNLFKETKSLSALAEQAINAQSALGKKRLPLPQDDWGDDEWGDFYNQLRPETLDGYTPAEKHSIQLEGQDIKEITLPEETVSELKQVAHDMGLTPKQYSQLEAKWAEKQVMSEGQLSEQINAAVQEQAVALRKEWGNDYALNHKAANEAYEALVQQVPELKELMEWSPIVANHPAVMKLFHTLSPLVADAGIPSQGAGSAFGQDTVAGIRAQISDFDAEHGDLLYLSEDKLFTLTPADKAKREKLLQERTKLYQKLYPAG